MKLDSTRLLAEQLREDSEVRNAMHLISERVQSYQEELSPSESIDELEDSYISELDTFAKQRGGGTFFPYLGAGMGRGPLVELRDGRVVYDLITGIGAFPAGHSDPRIVQTQLEAALSDLVIQGNLQQNKESSDFSELLIREACRGGAHLEHCFLSSTGVMAGENALKIALQKNAPAHRVLAFEGCFAGRTITFSQITDKPAFRDGLPENLPVDYVPFFDASDPEGSTARALDALDKHLKRHPSQHACMFFELVQGEGGFNVGEKSFFEALMRRCKISGVAVLVDEVQTFARTHSLFAFQHFGLNELVDVVWIGKASQTCATLFGADFKPRPGLLSQTFTSSTSALLAGKCIIESCLDGGYYGNDGKLAQLHGEFVRCIGEINTRNENRLKGPYGIGAMWAFTLDEGDPNRSREFVKHLFNHGVMSFMAGSKVARVRFLPPFLSITSEDLAEVFTRIEKALSSFQK